MLRKLPTQTFIFFFFSFLFFLLLIGCKSTSNYRNTLGSNIICREMIYDGLHTLGPNIRFIGCNASFIRCCFRSDENIHQFWGIIFEWISKSYDSRSEDSIFFLPFCSWIWCDVIEILHNRKYELFFPWKLSVW